MNYRKDIQVLRAVAVILVVIYHVFPDKLPSGYFGVDIFFVISGFLMAAIYQDNGDKSYYKTFYKKRFLRIVPAYFVVILFSTVIGAFIVLPHEHNLLFSQSLSSILFIPNIYFFWSGETYFDNVAFRPLLHLWSLGVELQFYLLVPVCMWIYRKNRAFFYSMALVSIITCLVMVEISSKTAFYLLPFRMWEFFFGFVIALNIRSNVASQGSAKALYSFLALLFIVGIAFYNSDLANHPQTLAVLVCFATSVILKFSVPNKYLDNFLMNFLEKVGKYSYSLYLVHYPLIYFTYYRPFQGSKKVVEFDSTLLLLFVSMVLATVLTHLYVETNSNFKRRANVAGLILILCLTMFGGKYINNSMFGTDVRNISLSVEDRSFWRCGKIQKLLSVISEDYSICMLNKDKQFEESALLIGDSTADAIKLSLSNVLTQNETNLYFSVDSCNLGFGWCTNENIIRFVEDRKISIVYLHQLRGSFEYEKLQQLLSSIGTETKIIYIESIPSWPGSVPEYLLKTKNKSEHEDGFTKTALDYLNADADVSRELDALEPEGLIRLSTTDVFCSPECLLKNKNSEPYYFDSIHLTLTGAKLLEKRFQI